MIKVVGVLLVVMAVMSGIFYMYYKDIQATIRTLNENNAKLTVSVDLQKDTIATMEADFKRTAAANNKLQKSLQLAEKDKDALREMLSKHNLTHLSASKPGLLQRRARRATSKLFRDIEDETKAFSNPAPTDTPTE